MNELLFCTGNQPDSARITKSQVDLSTLSAKYSFQDSFSLSYLLLLFVLPHFRSFRKIVAPGHLLIEISKWTIGVLALKMKSITTVGYDEPSKNINPDVSHQKNITYMYFKTFRVRPLTFSDLARLYNVTRKTIRRRAKRIGIVKTIGNFLSIAQINLYVQHYNWPIFEVIPGNKTPSFI